MKLGAHHHGLVGRLEGFAQRLQCILLLHLMGELGSDIVNAPALPLGVCLVVTGYRHADLFSSADSIFRLPYLTNT